MGNSGMSGFGNTKNFTKSSNISLNSTNRKKFCVPNQNLNQVSNLESNQVTKKVSNVIANLKEKSLEFFEVNYDQYIEFSKIIERKKVEPKEKEV